MNFLFFTFCFFISLLFFLPPALHKPLKQGLFLFAFLISLAFLIGERVAFIRKIIGQKNQFTEIGSKPVNKKIIWLGVSIVLISFLYHGYVLTLSFASNFQFHDADYVGMQEVIKNVMRGNSYLSTYYSASGEGSYLEHHVSPSLVFFLPFEFLSSGRWGYAIGVYFYLALGTVLWTHIFLAQNTESASDSRIEILYLVVLALISNLYIYRLGTSYHFEVLVYPLAAIFFSYFQKQKLSIGLFVSLLLLLMVKEDIAGYLLLFFTPFVFYNAFLYWKKNAFRLPEFKFLPRFKINYLAFIILVCLAYLGTIFFLIPLFWDQSTHHWIGALSGEYRTEFKHVTGIGKSIKIFSELIISMGFGFIFNLSAFIGILFIYFTHAFSSRPWHHEVYAYYCYTILPFLLYACATWIREKKNIKSWLFFFFLSLLFFRNLQDANYPININRLHSTNFSSEEVFEVQKEIEIAIEKNFLHSTIIFSQYNLSFFMPPDSILYPLSQTQLIKKICKQNTCYLVMAPQFTEDKLVSKDFILSRANHFKPGKIVYKGKWIEVWKSE